MTLLQNLNHFVALFLDTFRQFGRGRIWLTLLVYFLVQWLVLYAHYDFLSPLFYGVVNTWLDILIAIGLVSQVEADIFTHYPGQFLILPQVFSWARLLVGILFEGLVLGMVAVMFRNSYMREVGEDARPVGSTAAGLWVYLTIAWVLVNAVILLINILVPDLAGSFVDGSPRREKALEFLVIPGLHALLFGLLYFAVPAVAVFRENVLRALRRSLKLFLRRPLTSFFLGGIILFGPTVISFIAVRSQDIVTKFRPELVYWVLAAGLLVELIAYFFWMGTATRYLLDVSDE
ncbi:hypothetical protein GF420_10420 [candidate division GN15 bacterium]|nr:hypothetical protein [candidate division GN15 bacterium]